MTIEEKMDHFRSLSLESASSKSAESLSSYKQSFDDDLLKNHQLLKLKFLIEFVKNYLNIEKLTIT